MQTTLRIRPWLGVAVAMLLTSCGGGDAADEAVRDAMPLPEAGLVTLTAQTTCSLPGFMDALLDEVNAARATARTCGAVNMSAVGRLTWNERLFSAAARHSDDMARHNYFSHTGRDGRSPGERVSAEGYSWRIAGENIAAGQSSVTAVMAAWLASPGHCENLMRPEYTEVGVACIVAPGGSTYSRYWTMKLAQPAR